MSVPAYKKPFDTDDFRGYFTWPRELTASLGDSFYHACHDDEAKRFLREGIIGARSTWQLILPNGKRWECPGTWCGLNYFHNGNHYGPILFKIPLKTLTGRTFMVFRRTGDRNRYFFVQYEARIPIFEFEGNPWRGVKPAKYFDKATHGNGLSMKPGAIYDIVVTTPLKLRDATVSPVAHPKCISGKCSGRSLKKSRDVVQAIGLRALKRALLESDAYFAVVSRFPDIVGSQLELPEVPA